MTSDDSKFRPDVKWQNYGTGMSSTFRCGACCKPKSIGGRRLKRVFGLRQYVCKECAK